MKKGRRECISRSNPIDDHDSKAREAGKGVIPENGASLSAKGDTDGFHAVA